MSRLQRAVRAWNRLKQTVEDYYCAKSRVIPIRRFRFIVLIHTPTQTYHDIVNAISPPYYVQCGN